MRYFVLTIGLLLHTAIVCAQNDTVYFSLLNKIEEELDNAWATRDVPNIMRYYGNKAVLMPEYNDAAYGKTNIEIYVRSWLDSVLVSNCSHEIKDVQVLNGYLVEIGYAHATLLYRRKPPFQYHTKYLHVWDISKPDHPLLVAQIQGAIADISPTVLPKISIPQRGISTPSNRKLLERLHEKNYQFEQHAMTGNGAAMADLYTTDAIYMPYYQDMVRGREAINRYYTAQENPAVKHDKLTITIASLLDLGAYVIVNGYYQIQGPAADVNAQSINIWKKETDGDYKLFRQMVVHN
ncbi:MAG: DUF4440 domain-containing protein [Chitinophaga sp.]|uniref:DUF4440 domain-containing protein n=1 Tax=Chitinophaga sp. TaxID=1869181 RepID=UPI0025BB93F9|nr:DUF4440 domain-containing protein [Chitinophaga sp.]MBV8253552.1 DUF4440 domain-containing protein [Chitinophaga sp.]